MGLLLNHINTALGKLREAPITALPTDTSSEGWRAYEATKRAIYRVWNAKQWSFKIRSRPLTLVSGTLAYALPGDVGEIFSILSSADPYIISVVPESQFDQAMPNPLESGSPRYARLFDMAGAIAQPASSSTISISSSSASDSTQKVLIKGLVNDSYIDTEELSLSGTSVVASTKSFTSITAITKSDATAGAITVVAGATTLAIIWPQETIHRRRFIRFHPTPDAADTITLKNFGLPPLLNQAYEDTEIPTRWDYVVDQYAFAFALQAKGIEQDTEFKTQFDVANKFLDTDMAQEEEIDSNEIIQPQKWISYMGDARQWGNLPTGYGFTY